MNFWPIWSTYLGQNVDQEQAVHDHMDLLRTGGRAAHADAPMFEGRNLAAQYLRYQVFETCHDRYQRGDRPDLLEKNYVFPMQDQMYCFHDHPGGKTCLGSRWNSSWGRKMGDRDDARLR